MKVQKIQKMMRKDVSGGQRSKFKKYFQMVERSKIEKSEKK
jgi:hypothetical protein